MCALCRPITVALVTLATACTFTVNGKRTGGGGGGGGGPAKPAKPVAAAPDLPGEFDFPAAPPQEGEFRGCPERKVLARRWSTQNDMNGGGYGYYAVSYAGDRPAIMAYDQHKMQAQYGDSRGNDDDLLRRLWGIHCAYPDDAYVKKNLDKVREDYLRITGMSAETEAALHKAMIDLVAVDEEMEALCAAEREGAKGAVASVACRIRGAADPRGRVHGVDLDPALTRRAWTSMEHGDTNPIFPAAVVAGCRRIYDLQDGRYVAYRLCAADRARVDPAALDKALVAAGLGPYARARFRASFESGAAPLDELAAEIAKHEKSYPGDKKLFDESIAQVDARYVPLFAKWQKTLDDVEAWYGTTGAGPGDVEGCQEKLVPILQGYVDATLPKASGEALLDTLRDPVGFHLTEALAYCHLRSEDQRRARAIWERVLPGGVRIDGVHDAYWHVIERNGRSGAYKKVSTWGTNVVRLDDQPKSLAVQALGEVPGNAEGNSTAYEEDVAGGVARAEGEVLVTFSKKSAYDIAVSGCKEDFSHPRRIDEYGNIHYDLKGCKEEKIPYKFRRPGVKLAQGEGQQVSKGATILFAGDRGADWRKTEQPARAGALVLVKKGKDTIWAMGVRAK